MRKPRIIAASPGSSTARVPTTAAITPPRSMSPTSTTGHLCGAREAHVGDVAGAQVDLGRGARALDDDEVALRLKAPIALHHLGQQLPPRLAVIGRAERPAHAAVDDELRGAIGLRLQQHRVHVGVRLDPRGDRLHGLRAADLAAIGGHRGVVRHVLRLERAHRQPAIGERPAEARDERRFADVRPGSLKHQTRHLALTSARRQSSPAAPRSESRSAAVQNPCGMAA